MQLKMDEYTSMINYHFYKGKQLCVFLSAFWDNAVLSKWSTVKGKNLLPVGANSIL